ncbi:MAG: TRAP transporter small permease [Burkholderiaceae bacterium]|nr:TRAP transporter small permease [Burkholderiaceae bacterium]
MQVINSQDTADFIDPDYFQKGTGAVLHHLAKVSALLGAITLLGMALMSTISISGRVLFSQPLPGDFELAQLLSAVAVALFLPYCHVQRAHIFVDFFTLKAPKQFRQSLDACAQLLMSLLAALLSWRLAAGLISARAAQETTPILGFPIWIAFIALVLAFLLLSICAFYAAFAQSIAIYKNLRPKQVEQNL